MANQTESHRFFFSNDASPCRYNLIKHRVMKSQDTWSGSSLNKEVRPRKESGPGVRLRRAIANNTKPISPSKSVTVLYVAMIDEAPTADPWSRDYVLKVTSKIDESLSLFETTTYHIRVMIYFISLWVRLYWASLRRHHTPMRLWQLTFNPRAPYKMGLVISSKSI